MTRAQIRTAARAFLRDAGTNKHWTDTVLDDWAEFVQEWLVRRIIASNEDWYNHEQMIRTGSDGSFDLSTFAAGGAPTQLEREFVKPIRLVKKASLADAGGVPYLADRSRDHMVVRPAATYSIRRQTLIVNPREVADFAFQFAYWPKRWKDVTTGAPDNDLIDFPDQHHSLFAMELAIAAISEGGRDAPGPLAELAERLREEFESWLGRYNEEGPIVCETFDDVWSWGSI